MGKEKVLESIKKKSIRMVILFSVGTVLGACVGIFTEGFTRIIGFLMIALFGWMISVYAGHIKDPYTSDEIKDNPQLLDMADEHFANITYQDKYVTISNRMVSSTKDASQLAFLDEVYMIHISKSSMNFVPTGKDLVLSHARGKIEISVYNARQSTIDELFERFHPICPNACAGYTQDNLKYLNHKRQQWSKGVGVVPIKPDEQPVNVERQVGGGEN